MAFVGKTFNYQSVTAGDDGYLYDILSGQQNFMLSVTGGNPFTITNNVLTIKQCYMLISGRVIRVEANTTISLGTIPTTATKGRVIIRLDMSKLATETTFRQIETEVETTSGSYRALVQQSINSIDGQSANKYEAVMCEFTCSSGTASAPTRALVGNPFPIPIAKGGTGASTLNSAQTNLGIFTGLGTIIPSGADLNNYTTIGIYSVNSWNNAQNISNIPEKNAGKLVVFNTIGTDTTAMGQLYITHGHNHVYYRNRASSTWNSEWGLVGAGDIMKVTYQNEALTGLNSKQLAVDSLTKLRGTNFGVVSNGNRYITLEPGLYRIHTNFKTTPGANGLVKSCLKIGSTSTTIILTDQFYAGAGCGSNSSIIGVNATDVIKITANTNIYFLVMSQNNTDGCAGSLTIERLS